MGPYYIGGYNSKAIVSGELYMVIIIIFHQTFFYLPYYCISLTYTLQLLNAYDLLNNTRIRCTQIIKLVNRIVSIKSLHGLSLETMQSFNKGV